MKRQFRRFETFQDNVSTMRVPGSNGKSPGGKGHPSQDAQTQYLLTRLDAVAEQDTMPLATFNRSASFIHHEEVQSDLPFDLNGSPSTVSHKQRGSLSIAVQRMTIKGLARLQTPQPEGLFTRGLQIVKPEHNVLGMFPILMLTNALGLLIISLSYYISVYQFGNLAFELCYFLGLLLIFGPIAVRLISPIPTRLERICLLCTIGVCLYLVQYMVSPFHVSSYDEFLHWRTVADIVRTQHLFSVNSMLPVSPYYPGLEIVTDALSTTSGVSTFFAGAMVICAARLLMTLSLFMLCEQVTNSSRMAGIVTIIYMTNPHFLLFDAYFSYETFALPLATCMFYILVRYVTTNKSYRWAIWIACILLLAITVSHHMTDYVFDGLLLLWAIISLFQASSREMRKDLVTIALFGVVLSLTYAFLVPGNPVRVYLSEYFAQAFDQIGHILTGTSAARPLFVSPAGQIAPVWVRLLALVSIALVALGIPFGLLSLWQQHRHNVLAVMFGVASFAYPITEAMRLTTFGAEISDRAAPFLFLPIAYLLTLFITHFWSTRRLDWKATSLITCAISVIFLGGVALESGPVFASVPGPYLVVADQRSVEPEGLQAASWALAHLGPNNRVATDRINQMLMSTFGDQRIVDSSVDGVDIAPVFFSPQIGSEAVAILRQARVRYLIVDLRLSTALPLEGFYYDQYENGSRPLTSPISREALTKFDTIPGINRIFDSGDIVIYDVGPLVDGSGSNG